MKGIPTCLSESKDSEKIYFYEYPMFCYRVIERNIKGCCHFNRLLYRLTCVQSGFWPFIFRWLRFSHFGFVFIDQRRFHQLSTRYCNLKYHRTIIICLLTFEKFANKTFILFWTTLYNWFCLLKITSNNA